MINYSRCIIVLTLSILCASMLSAQTATDAAATGISRSFNPAISVNALFSGMTSNKENGVWPQHSAPSGMHCQAVDIEITSNVDVYLQSKIVLGGGEDEPLGVEEAYLTTLRLPLPVTLRGGMMLNTFGRYNLYHIHHMAFAENPLILQQVFGPKLREVGIEASYLLPLPWYAELLGGVVNGDNAQLFASDKQNDFGYLAHVDNFWEVSDEIALRLGGSVTTGSKGPIDASGDPLDQNIDDITSLTWGTDFHLKWKPLQYGRYKSFVLEGEYVNTTLDLDGTRTDPLHGYYLQGMYQLGLHWWFQVRQEHFNQAKELHQFFTRPEFADMHLSDALTGDRFSVALAYVPTEFGAYRLQYNRIKFNEETEQQVVLQVNVTVGSHPAHKY